MRGKSLQNYNKGFMYGCKMCKEKKNEREEKQFIVELLFELLCNNEGLSGNSLWEREK